MKWTEANRQIIRDCMGRLTAGQIAMKMGLRVQQIEGQIMLLKKQNKNGGRV
jgi:hypothetical protein